MAQLIYAVEDDPNIAHVLNIALTNSGFEAVVFPHAMDLYRALDQNRPQLFILDLMLPDIDGIAIIRELKKRPSVAKTPILIVSAKAAELDKVIGLDIGADDYLTKPFGILELVSRVKALLRRSDLVGGADIVFSQGIAIDSKAHVCTVNEVPIQLTAKEFALLKTMIQNKNQIVTRDELLNQVWGYDFVGETRTVDVHIKELRQKLNAAGASAEWIQTVRGIGYKFVE
jgi:two-component system, OmpR family, alkaline phosphatase synthesis response regulator PhoP